MSVSARAARRSLATASAQIQTHSRLPASRSFRTTITAKKTTRPMITHVLPPLRRLYSSETPKAKSPSSDFYKTFGRPIAKVFLLAIFTYQVIYYFWVRLEQDEMKRKLNATIAELEARIAELEATSKSAELPANAPEEEKKKGWW